eukprot:1154370-Pelagomonas_calceolata.AAC.3
MLCVCECEASGRVSMKEQSNLKCKPGAVGKPEIQTSFREIDISGLRNSQDKKFYSQHPLKSSLGESWNSGIESGKSQDL